MRAPVKLPEFGASVTVIEKSCGMLKIGDGFGIHLNRKPSRLHLAAMRLAFGWTWVPDLKGLTDG